MRYRKVVGVVLLTLVAVSPGGCRARAKGPRGADAGRILEIDHQVRFGEPRCPAPRVVIDDAGAHVSMYPSSGLLARVDRPVRASASPSLWQREIVPARGVCPSVPRRAGRLDLPALTSLLRSILASRPACADDDYPDTPLGRALAAARPDDRRVLVAASPATSVGEVTAVAEAAAAAGLTELRLLIYAPPDAACAGAITPADLRALAAP